MSPEVVQNYSGERSWVVWSEAHVKPVGRELLKSTLSSPMYHTDTVTDCLSFDKSLQYWASCESGQTGATPIKALSCELWPRQGSRPPRTPCLLSPGHWFFFSTQEENKTTLSTDLCSTGGNGKFWGTVEHKFMRQLKIDIWCAWRYFWL